MVEIVVVGIGYKRLGNSKHRIHKRSIASGEFHNRKMERRWMDNHIGFGACWHSRIVEPESEEQHSCIVTELVVDSKSSEQRSSIVSWLCSQPPSHF